MRMLISALGLAITAAVGGVVYAHATQAVAVEKIGPTYPVAEKHAIREIMDQLEAKQKSGELARIEQEAKERIEDASYNLQPVEGLGNVSKASVRYFEPSFTLKETLYDHEGNIVAPAGTVIKPLEVAPIPFKMFFFDGRSPEQVALAKTLAAIHGEQFMPILTAGRWDVLSAELNQAIYFDQQGRMSKSFHVTEVPSLVSQDKHQIRVEAMKP